MRARQRPHGSPPNGPHTPLSKRVTGMRSFRARPDRRTGPAELEVTRHATGRQPLGLTTPHPTHQHHPTGGDPPCNWTAATGADNPFSLTLAWTSLKVTPNAAQQWLLELT